jgi:hypothetical protein
MAKKILPTLGPGRGSSGAIAPKGWDRCVLADQVIPGFARITRGEIRLKTDKKQKSGADGCNPTFHGMDPQAIELEIITFSDEDREALVDIIAPLVPQPGKKPAPVSIDHPSLRILNVSAVQIIGAGALIPVEGKPMRARMQLHMLHWLPTSNQNATTTPAGAPKRKIPNARTRANPAPTQQPGFGAPPAGLQPT